MDLTWDWLQRLSANTLAFVSVIVAVVFGLAALWAAVAPVISFEARTMRDFTMVGILKDQGHDDLADRVQRRMDRRIRKWSQRKQRIIAGALGVYSLTSSAVVIIAVHTRYYAWSDYISTFNIALASISIFVLNRRAERARIEKEAAEQAQRAVSPEPRPRLRARTVLAMALIALVKWR